MQRIKFFKKMFTPKMHVSLSSAEQAFSFILTIIAMRISSRECFENERFVMVLRVSYIISNILLLLSYIYIKRSIRTTNDQRKLKVKKEHSLFQNEEIEEEVEMSYMEYDNEELTKGAKTNLIQFFVIFFLHLKWKIVQPLFVQSFAPLKNVLFSPLYMHHIFGKHVLRPFEQNMIFQRITPEATGRKRIKEE